MANNNNNNNNSAEESINGHNNINGKTTATKKTDVLLIGARKRRNAAKRRHLCTIKNVLLCAFITFIFFASCLPYFVNVQQIMWETYNAGVGYTDASYSLLSQLLPATDDNDNNKARTTTITTTDAAAAAAVLNTNTTTSTEDNDKEVVKSIYQPRYHVVFSTSCTDQQNWESYVFFYHAYRVKQPGTVTRIASGCSDSDGKKLQEFHDKYIQPMANKTIQTFVLHLTPDYSRVKLSEGKYPYKYMNKPYGMRHWMEEGLQLYWEDKNKQIIGMNDKKHDLSLLDDVVILMDPDMILLRPITHDFSSDRELWVIDEKDKKKKTRKIIPYVQHGNPIAQQDGYLANEWMKLDFHYITQSSDIKAPEWKDGPTYWNTGPPYLATVSDMYKIVSLWTITAPRVLEVHPKLFAEMYGFIIATVMLKLPFTLTRSIVISTTETSNREGWPIIDALHDSEVCDLAKTATSNGTMFLPVGLHYCKRYSLGKWFFSKYRLKKNIMNCDKPLLRVPNATELYPILDGQDKEYYSITPPRADLSDKDTYKVVHDKISNKQAKREAFMLCGMITSVNEALRYYKQNACTGKDDLPSPNFEELYSVHDDPTNH